MASRPRISVVTPSFNQARFLEDAIRSVVDQGYPELEYLVLDGGSEDGSLDIIQRYRDGIAYWRSRPDGGQAAALREGFERATGDILAWLNSDDLLADGALNRVADAWTREGGGVIVAGGCEVFGLGPPRTHYPRFHAEFGRAQLMPLTSVLDMARHWFPGEFFWQPEVFFPAREYREVGGIDPSFYYTMDYDLWVRFAIAEVPVVVLDVPLARYREHPQQKTADKAALYREMIATANSYLERAPLPDVLRSRIARSNRAVLLPPVREAWKFARRLRRRPRVR